MWRFLLICGLIAGLVAVPAIPRGSVDKGVNAERPVQPPAHTGPYPDLSTGKTKRERQASFDAGPQMQRGIPARMMLDQRRRLDEALDAISPERPGTLDAFVVTIALDSDPVFAREAREAGRVLERRYAAKGRTLVLAGPDGARDDRPHGSIDAFIISLARLAEIMDRDEDVLIVYTTSHGIKLGLAYHYGDEGFGVLSPARLKSVLDELGIKRRLLMLSACYSGVFVPVLKSPDTAILTAAADNRTSFGCAAENDWTFYGDALINNALRQPQSLQEAAFEAAQLVTQWEASKGLLASLPQAKIGDDAATWLATLEEQIPVSPSAPVGRPAIETRLPR